MSSKWTVNHTETGILRKSEYKEKKEELFMFGYSCKLFRDDDRALHIDQGKHLIPWMGDETLKIDRYDARGALHDLTRFEAPPGGYDWRVELTKSEHEVEQLCDEERYRALHTDEDEELMYKEEELKRLHAAGYGQVGFNYDTPTESTPAVQPTEVDEPFVPTNSFKSLFQQDTVFPDTQKQNAIIEKTAKFIAAQGAQMEILIKAKQRDNLQFKFLNKDDTLHPYYTVFTGLIKAGKWPEKTPEIVEEKPQEHEEYLHPSLASAVIESAPSIPSIHYKPSADCDYTMLISKMRGDGGADSVYELAPGELPPPGTEPPAPPVPTAPPAPHILQAPPVVYSHTPVMYNVQVPPPAPRSEIQPVYQQYSAYYQYPAQAGTPSAPEVPSAGRPASTRGSNALSLMKHYGSGSDTDHSDSEPEDVAPNGSKAEHAVPPDDVKLVIEKMSRYVARNGDEFADIVRAKNDPRFSFLSPGDIYHEYYCALLRESRGEGRGGNNHKTKPPVSFSIKKMKEPDPILPKPALPYESSSDEDPDKQTDKQADKPEEIKVIQPLVQQTFTMNNMPPVLVYKMEGQLTQNLPTIKTIESVKQFVPKPVIPEIKEVPKPERIAVEKVVTDDANVVRDAEMVVGDVERTAKETEVVVKEIILKKPEKETTPVKEIVKKPIPKQEIKTNDVKPEKPKENDKIKEINDNRQVKESEKVREKEISPDRKEKKRSKDKRDIKSHRSKTENRDKRSRSRDRERKREKDKDREKDNKKRRKVEKDDLESEIISLEDNSDDMIDLTGDLSDSKGEGEPEAEKAKQMERRRRAAEFLKKVGVDPSAAALPNNSLASAMVDTLESIRKKKAAEEEKRRRKEKRRRREKREQEEAEKSHRKSKRRKYKSSDENDESDYESSKRKKRKKDKKTSKKKKKRYEPVEIEETVEEDQALPANMNLSSTLKELRTYSPTKNLIIPDIEENIANDTSSEEEKEVKEEVSDKKKKKEREYSEGEWSSDSEVDSNTSGEERNKLEE